MKRLTAAAALTFALVTTPSFAQCPLAEITISGRVVDAAGRPVPNSRIAAVWTERAAGEVSNQRDTNDEGDFSMRIPFDTFSGRTFLGEARCEATLGQVTLTVTSPGYRPLVEEIDPTAAPAAILLVLETE